MKDPVEKRILLLFLLVVVLLAGISIVAVGNIQRTTISNDRVNNSHAVISELESIYSSMVTGDAALWSYALTGDDRDLAACRRGYSAATEHLEVVKSLISAGTKQADDLNQLHPLVAKRVEFARDLVNARKQGGVAAAQRLVPAGAGGMVEIQHLLGVMKEREEALVRERDKQSYLQAQNTRWTVFVGGAIHLLVVGVLYYLIRNTLAARRKAAATLAEANQKLDATVKERTLELAASNDALVQENLEQRWTNQALDHQLRYNQLIINSIEDLVFVISKVSNVIRVNPAVTRWTGFETQELIGVPLHKLLRQPDAPVDAAPAKHPKVVQCLKEGRDLLDSPGILCAKDGRTATISFNVFPLRDRDKIVGGVLTIKIREPHS